VGHNSEPVSDDDLPRLAAIARLIVARGRINFVVDGSVLTCAAAEAGPLNVLSRVIRIRAPGMVPGQFGDLGGRTTRGGRRTGPAPGMRFQAQTSEAAAHWVPKIAVRFPDRCSARVGSAPSGADSSRTARHVAGLRMAFLRN
jgi:hypothetical protein